MRSFETLILVISPLGGAIKFFVWSRYDTSLRPMWNVDIARAKIFMLWSGWVGVWTMRICGLSLIITQKYFKMYAGWQTNKIDSTVYCI